MQPLRMPLHELPIMLLNLSNFHALPCVCALHPLFYEKAATPAMIKHGMDVKKWTIQYLNPGQIPVTTLDQPLFALAKLIQ